MITKNLEIAINAAIDGGEEIMKIYQKEFEVEIKDDNSPLTIADKNANTIINKYLVDTNIPIISEENKQIAYDERKDWVDCWIVDPLDGTKEFVKRNGEFTVNIALVENGKPVLGVIYVPVSKTLYYGDSNQGYANKITLKSHQVSLSELQNDSTAIKADDTTQQVIKVVGSRSHMNDDTLAYVKKLEQQGQSTEIVSKGSSLKFCLVAEGHAHVYPRFAPTMEWDTAAGQAICEAVGLQVISQETQEPLLYNKKNLLNPWFLVSK